MHAVQREKRIVGKIDMEFIGKTRFLLCLASKADIIKLTEAEPLPPVAPLFGAFRLFLFDGRQPTCIEENRKSPEN